MNAFALILEDDASMISHEGSREGVCNLPINFTGSRWQAGDSEERSLEVCIACGAEAIKHEGKGFAVEIRRPGCRSFGVRCKARVLPQPTCHLFVECRSIFNVCTWLMVDRPRVGQAFQKRWRSIASHVSARSDV